MFRGRLRLLPGRLARPAVLVLSSFVAAVLTGTVLLSLPMATTTDGDATLLDAFFTATSAVTVTGLATVDTGTTWSGWGLGVILVLIQIGGMGIMTLAGFAGIVLDRRLRLASGARVATELGLDELGDLGTLVIRLVRFSFAAEATAALALWWRFATTTEGSTLGALGRGVFHAVSAFNNAGFSTYADSFAGPADDPGILVIAALAFIVGGLGFPVVFELVGAWRRPQSWSLHTKVTLVTTALLLVVGSAVIALAEWTNPRTIGDAPVGRKLLDAAFQSATARTAGFNSVDIGALRPGTWTVLIFLMLVGAGSASTGGGLKVTTLAVAVRAMVAEFRHDGVVVLGGRRIGDRIHRQALALVAAAAATVTSGTLAVSLAAPDLALDEILFESASAFATVGLSTGITPELDTAGRLVLCALMLIGRVGPVTFGTAVLLRPRARRVIEPDGRVMIG